MFADANSAAKELDQAPVSRVFIGNKHRGIAIRTFHIAARIGE